MYAIVEIGGKQYKVEKDSSVLVEKIEAEEGKKINLDKVTLLRTDKDILIGTPYLDKVNIEAKVETPVVKGEKKVIFKYKQKVPHRVKKGHRQNYTLLTITAIHAGA